MSAKWGLPRLLENESAGLLPAVSNGVLLSFPSVGMELRNNGAGPSSKHRLASWELPIELPSNEGLHGVRADFHWYQFRPQGVRATIFVSLGHATCTLSFPSAGPGLEPQEAERGTVTLFSPEDWPAQNQFAVPRPGRALSVPVVISILVQHLEPDSHYVVGVEDMDLRLFPYPSGRADEPGSRSRSKGPVAANRSSLPVSDRIGDLTAKIRAIELPRAARARPRSGAALPGVAKARSRSVAELPSVPEYKTGIPQVVTVGSQIAEFAAGVPEELRRGIANCFLLAQLAADRWVETKGGGARTWYNVYVSVLKKCGWIVEGDASSLRSVTGSGAQIHSELVSILTKALGATAVAAGSLLLDLLNGVKSLDKGQAFLTLFEHASQRAAARLFQISYVDADAKKFPRINIAAYELNAEHSVTQVLFFKLDLQNAKLRSFSADVTVDPELFAALAPAITEKVKDHVRTSVAEIEI
jgi:hypothetical protein